MFLKVYNRQQYGMSYKTIILDGHAWILLCAQLLEASYLHEEAHVFHNDLKVDNVLVARSVALTGENYQVVLIDFCKATRLSEAKHYNLSEFERREYIRKYSHIVPEGELKRSTFSDMFSFGSFVTDNGS